MAQGSSRGTADTLASLTVHPLERQEASALLRLYILLEGEGQLLQPCNDLLHLRSPAGAAKTCFSPCRWTLYSSWEALKGPGSDAASLIPGCQRPGDGHVTLSPRPPDAGADTLGPHAAPQGPTPPHPLPMHPAGEELAKPLPTLLISVRCPQTDTQHTRRHDHTCAHSFTTNTKPQVSFGKSSTNRPQ